MADAKISSLTALTGANLVDADVFVVEDLSTATTKKMTAAEMRVAAPWTASTSQPGFAEAAIASEVNTGTDAARYVSPDALAGSIFGTESVTIQVVDAATTLTTGDGKIYFRVPAALNGMNLVSVGATVYDDSSSGTPTVQIARGRCSSATSAHSFVDMLSTAITIDASEFDSKDATTPPVVNTSNDDVLTGDLIRIDVDVAGTGVEGLWVTMGFQLP